MNEARLKEVRQKVDAFKDLDGKDLLSAVIKLINDEQCLNLLAGHEEFSWVFKKLDKIVATVPTPVLNLWRTEIQQELGRAYV